MSTTPSTTAKPPTSAARRLAAVAPARALPGMDGALNSDVPKVERAIDDQSWNVTLDVTEQLDLAALFRAIAQPGAQHLRESMRVLMHNPRLDMQLLAARDLRQSPEIRRALTLTLGPAQAEDLGIKLDNASTEPGRCESSTGDCNNFVEDDGRGLDVMGGRHLCPGCLVEAQGE